LSFDIVQFALTKATHGAQGFKLFPPVFRVERRHFPDRAFKLGDLSSQSVRAFLEVAFVWHPPFYANARSGAPSGRSACV
jgi:hypothetical protein